MTRSFSFVSALACGWLAAGCSSEAPDPAATQSTAAQSILGSASYDASCSAASIPHIEIGLAYARIAANSAAFRACINTAMAQNTTAGMPNPPLPITIGPYNRCSTDPAPTTADTVIGLAGSPDGEKISCVYQFDGSVGGFAFVGNINAQQQEVFALQNVLAGITTTMPDCALHPGVSPCVGDDTYNALGYTAYHEAMHAHGYDHFEYGNDSNGGVPHLCGIPAGQNPSYANSVPYIVQECIRSVLTQSEQRCDMHVGCPTTALKLVDSVYATPSTCSCVANPAPDPVPELSLPPPPPNAPTHCVATAGCSDLTWTCDPQSNASLWLQSRPSLDPTAGWSDEGPLVPIRDEPYDFRVCASTSAANPPACTGPIAFGPPDLTGCSGGGGGGGGGGKCTFNACQTRCHSEDAACCPEGPGGKLVCACNGCGDD